MPLSTVRWLVVSGAHAIAVAALVSACGSGGGGPAAPTVAPAKTFQLIDFEPSGPVTAGKPTVVSFKIRLPSGETLTQYRRGAGPHTGIHLLVVRDDLTRLIHRHPRIAPDGTLRQQIVFPSPGVYRIVADTYPNIPESPELRNFQLFAKVRVNGTYRPQPTPPFSQSQTLDGYRVTIVGKPKLKAIVPASLTLRVTDRRGRPPKFAPYYGALAHAIFFREGSGDYFHTHVCGPNTPACGSVTGAPAGTSTAPGVLKAGILLPLDGVWRLFLQFRAEGKVFTVPFTFRVRL